jgi:hypothetical protein
LEPIRVSFWENNRVEEDHLDIRKKKTSRDNSRDLLLGYTITTFQELLDQSIKLLDFSLSSSALTSFFFNPASVGVKNDSYPSPASLNGRKPLSRTNSYNNNSFQVELAVEDTWIENGSSFPQVRNSFPFRLFLFFSLFLFVL